MNNELTENEYQRMAMRTADENKDTYLDNAIMGLCGEVGECADIVKKHRFQGHDLDREHLIDELSDVCWYVALLATALDTPLEDVMRHNIDKLRKRYPDGFDKERSIHRDEKPVKYREEYRTAKVGEKIKLVTNGGFTFNRIGDIMVVDEAKDNGYAGIYGKNHLRETEHPEFLWPYFAWEYVVLVPEEE